MRISDWSSDVCSSDLNAASIAGDQARDIDSLRLQNRTRFDLGAAQLDVGVFVNAKTLHHPIYQLIDQKSVDRGGYFRFDYAPGPVAAPLGGELRDRKRVA